MFERFTQAARQTVVRAQASARELGHGFIAPEHLLLGLASGEAGDPAADVLRARGVTAARVREELARITGSGALGPHDAEALQAIGIDLDAVRASVEEAFGPGALDRRALPGPDQRGLKARLRRRNPEERTGGHLPVTPRARKSLEYSLREAVRLQQHEITSSHVLLGLLRVEDSVAVHILTRIGVDLDALRGEVLAGLSRAA